jgi:putative phage-type endonuclease
MRICNLKQGTPEWHAHRREHFNASDAPAMMGVSPYKTRAQLVRELATGFTPEETAEKRALFAAGHRTEALALDFAQKLVGDDLYAVVGVEDGSKRSASFDGLTMDGSIAWEHKMLNNDIRAALDTPEATGADLPMFYRVQMEQQCMVSKCERVLFTATRYSPAGELLEERHCWYEPDPALAEQIRAGWAQLEADVAAYKPEADVVEVKPVARVIEALPALVAQVEGRVVTTNLQDFRLAASRFIEGIKTDLQTDQDFADAAQTIKFCEDGEKRLALAKEQALAQTSSIDELFRTIDAISGDLRAKRLTLDKLVEQRKVAIRAEIAAKAQADMDAHWAAVGERLGESWIKRAVPDFPGAMKGKRSIETCRAAVDQTLANAKIEMTQLADRLLANRETLKRDGTDWLFLFADFAQVGAKAPEDFRAVAELRIRDHLAAQERAAAERRERISTRIEELRQARTAHVGVVAISQALVRIRANQPSTDLYGDRLEEAAALHAEVVADLERQLQAARDADAAPVAAPAPAAVSHVSARAFATKTTDAPCLTLREINARLGVVTLSEANLAALGFPPKALYPESDFPAICRAIAKRVAEAADRVLEAA